MRLLVVIRVFGALEHYLEDRAVLDSYYDQVMMKKPSVEEGVAPFTAHRNLTSRQTFLIWPAIPGLR
jgi:hypothetical protein